MEFAYGWTFGLPPARDPLRVRSSPMVPDPQPTGPEPAMAGNQDDASVMEPVTCLVCGCLCDDIAVPRHGDTIVEAGNACDLGREWLLCDRSWQTDLPAAVHNGQPVAADEAVEQAAQLLMAAHAPIILGLSRSTNETVAAALELADRLGAVVDVGDGRLAAARALAFQRAGKVSATLGEVKNRADVVVFWGTDPVVTHPRHWERYSVAPRGRFVPEGRDGRTVIVVDRERTATAEQADFFMEIDASRQFEILWLLRALVQEKGMAGEASWKHAGVHPSQLRELSALLAGARYGAFFHGPLTAQGTASEVAATLEAAYGLVRDLNRRTRFVILGMGEPGNAQGAEAVLTWQTGFPTAVDLSAGYPRSLPGVTTADRRIAQGEADVAVIVGATRPEQFDDRCRRELAKVSTVVIAPPDEAAPWLPAVTIRAFAATPGLDDSGTVVRVDGVALPIRPIRASRFPSEREWIEAIRQRVAALARN